MVGIDHYNYYNYYNYYYYLLLNRGWISRQKQVSFKRAFFCSKRALAHLLLHARNNNMGYICSMNAK